MKVNDLVKINIVMAYSECTFVLKRIIIEWASINGILEEKLINIMKSVFTSIWMTPSDISFIRAYKKSLILSKYLSL